MLSNWIMDTDGTIHITNFCRLHRKQYVRFGLERVIVSRCHSSFIFCKLYALMLVIFRNMTMKSFPRNLLMLLPSTSALRAPMFLYCMEHRRKYAILANKMFKWLRGDQQMFRHCQVGSGQMLNISLFIRWRITFTALYVHQLLISHNAKQHIRKIFYVA